MQNPTLDSPLSGLRQRVEVRGETFVTLDALDKCDNIDELLDLCGTLGLEI